MNDLDFGYQATLEQIYELAQDAGKLYVQLNRRIEDNHKIYIDPIEQDQKDTNNYAQQVADLVEKAQQVLSYSVSLWKTNIDKAFHTDVTSDQLANVNQLKNYDNLSEDELNSYLDKWKSNRALLKAFEAVIKSKGWVIDGPTYDTYMNFINVFQNRAQEMINGMQNGTARGLPVDVNVAYRLTVSEINRLNEGLNTGYSLRRK